MCSARAWGRQVGRLQPGAQADLVVINANRGADPFSTIVSSTEDDIDLVVIDGIPRYGTSELTAKAVAASTTALPAMTTVPVGGRSMKMLITQPSNPTQAWEWDEILERLEEVRTDPRHEVEAAQSTFASWAGKLDRPNAPLRLALDMPTGLGPIGGLPKDLNELVVPPLQSLTHDPSWLARWSAAASTAACSTNSPTTTAEE